MARTTNIIGRVYARDNLRAELHGDVIPPEFANVNDEDQELFDEISNAAPIVSPNRQDNRLFHNADRNSMLLTAAILN